MSTDRTYRSELREQQTRETRSRIRASARELFSRNGLAETTVDAIADDAGVSPATVYVHFESKAGIVTAMLDDLEESADIGGMISELANESDPQRQLRIFVAAHCRLFDGGRDILQAALAASHLPEVARLMEHGDGNRRGVINHLVRDWQQKGALREGLSITEAGDRMWLLTTVEGYLTATDRLQWESARYQEWLSELLEREILGVDPGG